MDDYDLPELLVDGYGNRIRTVEQWNKIRRPDILRTFQEEVYGKVPDV
jgi:hypothetical protein